MGPFRTRTSDLGSRSSQDAIRRFLTSSSSYRRKGRKNTDHLDVPCPLGRAEKPACGLEASPLEGGSALRLVLSREATYRPTPSA